MMRAPAILLALAVTATAASKSTAILVDTGGSLPTIRNSGTIKASAQAGDGSATAILDRSGTVSLIENRLGIWNAALNAIAPPLYLP